MKQAGGGPHTDLSLSDIGRSCVTGHMGTGALGDMLSSSDLFIG